MIFDNVRATSVHTHSVESESIAVFMKASAQLFQLLDRSDNVQSEFSLRLWILRSTIAFTLLPFSNVALDLRGKMDDLSRLSTLLPDTSKLVESLARTLDNLLSLRNNPKLERMLALAESASVDNDWARVALFHNLASGKSPGWPAEALPALISQFSDLQPIGRKHELRSGVFGRIILPCGCQNAPPALLGEVFHSGRARTIDALLYSGERLRIPKRLELPVTLPFKGSLQRTTIDHETHSTPIDAWVNEAFWQGIHGAERTTGVNRVRAHYTLFCDGTGTFLSANRRALVLVEGEQFSGENDLRLVRIEDLCEGELVVLRVGSSGTLLDEESDQIMAGLDEQSLVEDATNWKSALEALLLTHSAEEVAQAVRERGVTASATSVRQWAGVDALGPGNERVFEVLISVLGERGKITPSQDWKAHAADLWSKLRELRSVRQKAGNVIRHDLLDALRTQFSDSSIQLADRTSVQLEGGSATKLLILRVSSIDQAAAFIQPSRLLQIDDLRENKWLG